MRKQQWTENEKNSRNTSMTGDESLKQKKDVITEARNEGKTGHFASLLDICHFKNSELEQSFKTSKAKLYSEVAL